MGRRPRHLLSVALLSLVAVGGCGDDEDPAVPSPDATAYAAALVPFLPAADPEAPPKVFIAPFDKPLSLEAQVAIIETIGDGYDVSFVDEAQAVVDTEAEGHPVREDALLLIVGSIPPEPPYVARVETYRSEGERSASLVTLVWRTDHWEVVTEEQVDPEAVILVE